MTNLQKVSNLISDILDLKLGVGDIVEDRSRMTLQIVLTSYFNEQMNYFCYELNKDYSIPTIYTALWLSEAYHKLKLKQRNITLLMVLRAFEHIRKFHTHLDINSKGYLTYWESIDEEKTKQVDWQLRKDGKDCSLFDQKNETVKFIIKVLK